MIEEISESVKRLISTDERCKEKAMQLNKFKNSMVEGRVE